MDGYNGINERAGVENLVAYLSDGDEICIQCREKDLYRKQVDAALEHMFERLDQIFRVSCRDNKEVCDALSGFSSVCQDAYFKAGLAAGFQICKNLDREYLNVEGDGAVKSMIEKIVP